MIAAARQRTQSSRSIVEFQLGDGHCLPFDDGLFDGCRCDRTLQHVEDPRQVMRELTRVARRSARVVVSEPDWETLLVDSPDRHVTRYILNARCDRVRHGWIGRLLPSLFDQVGLTRLAVRSFTLCVSDLALAVRLFDLEVSAERACADGIVSDVHADNWLAGLRAADEAGRFFCAATIFVVVGQKP
jgi:SAM-dependent methyltransferase